MWSKFKNSRAFYMLLSVIIAVICWLYVDLARTPDARVTISNIPVTFIGEEKLAAENLLILDDQSTISIVVSGPRSVITKLNRNNIMITAQTSSITKSGVYSLVCDINLPSAVTSTSPKPVGIVSRSASAVDVNVVQMVKKSVMIHSEFTGTVGENRFYDDNSFVLQQREIEISGEESDVAQVSYAKVVLEETNLTDTWTGWLNVILCDQEGNPVKTDNITLETDAISAAFYVECSKEIPLRVELISGGGASAEDVSCKFSPADTIMVTGQEVVLDGLEELVIGSVELGQIVTTGEYEFDIQLPKGVTSMDGVTKATVQVSVDGLETRKISTQQIQIINAPEGYSYLHNPELEVRVRGKAENFDMLMSEDILVTLDLSQVDLKLGEHVLVPAKVEIVGISELGIIGNYNMDVLVEAKDAMSHGETNPYTP